MMVIRCCGQEMIRAGDWYHCEICGMRLRAHPHGQEKAIISEMVIEEVQENMMTWKEFYAIFHELWRAGHYEDYEPNIPDEWIPRDADMMERIEEGKKDDIKIFDFEELAEELEI